MEYGYSRVSSKDQNLERQLQALREVGIEERYIYTDKVTGKTFNRPSYNLLVGTDTTAPLLREGDLLTILSIDRLGRDYEEIRNQWEYITKVLKADIRVLDMPLLDTRTENKDLDKTFISDLVLQILSYVAEKERISIKTRQRQGIDVMPEGEELTEDGRKKKVSSKTGRYTGRPKAQYPSNWEEVYTDWKQGNRTATQSMNDLGLTRNTFYNLVKRYESK